MAVFFFSLGYMRLDPRFPRYFTYLSLFCFSMLGLVKWHTYTKYAHKREILVTTHPYRMWESDAVRRLRSSGFRLRKIKGHSFGSNVIGHARDSTFLGIKNSA